MNTTVTKYRDKITFTVAEMEAALCAFEWMMDQRTLFDNTVAEARKPHTIRINELFESIGWSAMRFVAMQAGAIADHVYKHTQDAGMEFAMPFDWEFVPAVLMRLDWDALVQDNQYAGPVYWPDPAPILAELIKAAPDDFVKPDKHAEYFEQLRAQADRQWAYPDLVGDHTERCEQAFTSGQAPAEFIRWLGEHYDLTPRSVFERGY